MGKRGSINLVIPKNDASKSELDKVLTILKNNGGQCDSATLHDELEKYYESLGKTLDATSISHRSVIPRYFGFVTKDGNDYYLTEFGDYYISSNNWKDQMDCIFLAIASVTFGRNNNAVASDSDIEAPNVFLKAVSDLGEATITQIGIILYKMEVEHLSYNDSIRYVRGLSNPSSIRQEIASKGGNKLFDLKFNLLFEDWHIVEKNEHGAYQLTNYVYNTFIYFIRDLSAHNDNTTTDIVSETIDSEPSIDDILKNIEEKERKYDGIFKNPNFMQTGKMRVRRISKRIGFKSRNKLLSENQCNKLGWLGEKYINDLLNSSLSELHSKLDLKEDEAISSIEWFNNGCTMDQNWKDQSVGHGCDFEVITTKNRTLQLEVKTSLSNTPFFSATTNELVTMATSKTNYFLIKIENLRALYNEEKPTITIVNNPIRILDNVGNIKEISLYI